VFEANGYPCSEPLYRAWVLRVGLQMRREIDMPEGEALLRVGIYDANSGKAGTLGISLGPDK
jgi:hypothetical protein